MMYVCMVCVLTSKKIHVHPFFFFVLFICLLVTGSCSVAQGGLKFLGSFDCPAPVSWVAGTTGASH